MNIQSTVIVAIISACAAILAAVVTAAFASVNSRYSLNSPKRCTILEDQLVKVFAPLQHIMQSDMAYPEKQKEALSIMNDNFILVPSQLYQAKDRDAFPHLIEACFHISRKKLGYTQVIPTTKYSHISEVTKAEEIIAPSRKFTMGMRGMRKPRSCTFDTLLEQLDEVDSCSSGPDYI